MNIIRQGDSLGLLNEVENNTVQTIYFDPPFKTQKEYVLAPDDETGFSDSWESNQAYIDFVEPLVKKCKEKLKPDGTFFFHISAAEMLIPQMICNKHFKEVHPIFWKKSRSKNNVKRKLGTAVDIIFMCTLSSTPKFNMVYQELDSYYAENSYKNKDERGYYALGHIVYTATQKTTKEERLYSFMHDEVEYKPENGWRLSKERLEELVADNRIHFPKKTTANPYKKIYKHESKGKPCMDLWDDIHSIAQGNEKRKYPTEKPVKLLERIIEMSSDEGDVILDPVAGSGTTGVAAKRMGRNFILFDINPDAVEIAQERTYRDK